MASGPTSCDKWRSIEVTDSLEGTEGIVDRYERSIDVGVGQEEAVFRRLEDRLLRYQIFPPRIMRSEICSDDGRIHEDTTIVQYVSVGPVPLESAVRVQRMWHSTEAELEETGFSYATIRGHPERGVSTFRIRRTPGRITFLIDARSRPGSILTRVGRPIARRFQRAATEAALDHVLAGADGLGS